MRSYFMGFKITDLHHLDHNFHFEPRLRSESGLCVMSGFLVRLKGALTLVTSR